MLYKNRDHKEPSLISYNENNSPYKSMYDCGQNIYILKLWKYMISTVDFLKIILYNINFVNVNVL